MKYLTNIDLNRNELQNARIHQIAGDPASANLVSGMLWMDTSVTPKVLKYYNGTDIIVIGSAENTEYYGVCSTAESTAAKVVTVEGDFSLKTGVKVVIKFTNGNYAANSATLNVNSTGAKTMRLASSPNLTEVPLMKGGIYEFIYDGTYWSLMAGGNYVGDFEYLNEGDDDIPRLWSADNISQYVNSKMSVADAMRFKGTVGTGGTVTTLPTTGVKIGDTYRVITAGTYAGQTCEIGDLIIATATTPTWTVAQTNIDGAITSITGTSPVSVTGTGLSRTISVSNATTVSSGLIGPGYIRLINDLRDYGLMYVGQDQTHLQVASYDTTYELFLSSAAGKANGIAPLNASTKIDPQYLPLATTTTAGAMSASDKRFLDDLGRYQRLYYTNPALTASNEGVCKWTITLPNFRSGFISQIKEISTGQQVIADTKIGQNGQFQVIEISFISSSNIAADTYSISFLRFD